MRKVVLVINQTFIVLLLLLTYIFVIGPIYLLRLVSVQFNKNISAESFWINPKTNFVNDDSTPY